MNATELERISDLICNTLHSKENVDKTKPEHMKLIKPIIIKLAEEYRQIGRNQIINLFSDTIQSLKS